MANLDEVKIKITQESKGAKEIVDTLVDSLGKLGNSLNSLGKLAIKGAGLGVVYKYLKNSIVSASKYTQTLNMTYKTLGKLSQGAEDLADKLSSKLMLSKADVMSFQGTFQNLFVGFGNTAQNAQIMSQNLTQLSYDLAAYSEQVGEPTVGMGKLRLAMAGTIEPIQRLGFAIKEADLQQVAARQGINVNIRNLNTASKSMLRYIAVMEQSTHIQGTWAKEFNTPAVALATLTQSLKDIGIEVGKVLLPTLMAALPYVQALTQGILNMVKTITSILGIELPTIKGWEDEEPVEGLQNISDEAEKAGKSIKKALTMGIDELNVLDNTTDGLTDITSLLKLPEYDMTEFMADETLQAIQDKLAPLEPLFNGIAEAVAGFYSAIKGFTDTYLYPWLVNVGDWMEEHPETMNLIGKGLAVMAGGWLALKGVGAIAKILDLAGLITVADKAKKALDKLAISYTIDGQTFTGWSLLRDKIFNVAYIAGIAYGAFLLVSSIINIIQGKKDVFENVRTALAGIFVMLTSYIAFKAIPQVLTSFTTFQASAGFIFKNLGVVGSAAMLGIAAAGGVALAYLLLNWDDASYSIQQTFGEIAKNVVDTIATVGQKFTEIMNKIKKIGIDVFVAIVKTALTGFYNLYDWAIKPILSAVDSIFHTDWSSKLSLENLTSKVDEFGNAQKAKLDKDTEESKKWWDDWKAGANSFWDDYLAESQAMYDEYLAEQEKEEAEKRAREEEERKKATEEETAAMQAELDKLGLNGDTTTQAEMPEIEMPEIEMPEIDDISSQISSMSSNTEEALNTATQIGETQLGSQNLQTQYNTSSLANDTTLQATMEAIKSVITQSTTEIKNQLTNNTNRIITALAKVQTACENIRINITNKYYSSGGDGYAIGGTPISGEYFYAREDGIAEMVGRVGRQTTVLNNEQVADTMATSLIKAMSQSGTSQQPTVIENKLYLDGEVVYNNQQKIQRSKGYSLGLGVFANV